MRRADLVAECSRCSALCCVATSFDESEAFAFAKAAGTPCPQLGPDHRCRIHEQLVERGCAGCHVYDCYGAGPRATRAFDDVPVATRDAAFLALRDIHELIWLLSESIKLCPEIEMALRGELARAIDQLETLAASPAAALIELPLASRATEVHALLRRVGAALGGRQHHALRVIG